ncbi:major centromere autoantigen B-like protein [Lates japonicus]|uniref:Major centromere autoantigen B-like protein n=1 Tax=Lates japonicus TaxID=270547 RepID=A0AAD3NKV6_LATJO|nr:major centromere autoantigen B-like protein [Lates japonicus]
MAFRRPQMPEEDPGVIYVSDDDDAVSSQSGSNPAIAVSGHLLHQRASRRAVEQPEGGLLPFLQGWDPAPSSSGVSTSTKRSRESDTEEVSMKDRGR